MHIHFHLIQNHAISAECTYSWKGNIAKLVIFTAFMYYCFQLQTI